MMSVNYHNNTEQIAMMLRNAHNPNICKIRKDFFNAEFSFLKSQIHGKNVMIAGSGLGHDSFVLSEYCKYITGIELIQAFVDEANDNLNKNGYTNISFVAGDFLNLDYGDKYFDVSILNMGTIGNFDDKEKVVQSLFRVANKLYFGFREPNKNDIQIRLQMYQEEKDFRDVEFEIQGTTIKEKLSGLESNCTKVESIQDIVDNMGAKVKFHPIFKSFIIAEVF